MKGKANVGKNGDADMGDGGRRCGHKGGCGHGCRGDAAEEDAGGGAGERQMRWRSAKGQREEIGREK